MCQSYVPGAECCKLAPNLGRMVKGRIQHGLAEAVGAERLYLLHGKAEQPGF